MTPEQFLISVLSVVFGLIGIVLTIRNWVYGGSIIRVEIELCRRGAFGGLITGDVTTWRDKDNAVALATPIGAQVDLVKVTVRNLGRTSATIHDVGLRVGPAPVPVRRWTVQPNFLLEPGQVEQPVRVDAHDVKVFYFHALPSVRAGREEFGDGSLAFRASVLTGTGKERLSACWRRGKWNVWTVRGAGDRSITGQELTTREQSRLWVELTQQVYEPDPLWVRQVSDHAAQLVDQGKDHDDVYEKLMAVLGIFQADQEDHRTRGFIRGLVDHLIKLRTKAEPMGTTTPAS